MLGASSLASCCVITCKVQSGNSREAAGWLHGLQLCGHGGHVKRRHEVKTDSPLPSLLSYCHFHSADRAAMSGWCPPGMLTGKSQGRASSAYKAQQEFRNQFGEGFQLEQPDLNLAVDASLHCGACIVSSLLRQAMPL
ncbi:hypothetical protein ABPG77_010551 [Micractinium sp. CCAP 211/92]